VSNITFVPNSEHASGRGGIYGAILSHARDFTSRLVLKIEQPKSAWQMNKSQINTPKWLPLSVMVVTMCSDSHRTSVRNAHS
jgi:hypothetical protein